jgi:hypothetical protein
MDSDPLRPRGLWQDMPLDPPDYAAIIDRLNNMSESERTEAALRYIRFRFAQEGITLSQPGRQPLEGTVISNMQDLDRIEVPAGSAAVLHSAYGTEGVFTDTKILRSRIFYLKTLSAYRAEKFSVSVHPINPETHT